MIFVTIFCNCPKTLGKPWMFDRADDCFCVMRIKRNSKIIRRFGHLITLYISFIIRYF